MSYVGTDFVILRVLLEGVLFPYVQSVNITEGIGNVRCQMQVPSSIKLKPEELIGAKCHIFYLTEYLADKYSLSDPGNTASSKWPILFQGELVGESTSAQRQSRNVTLMFSGHGRHFDQTQLYFYDPSRDQNIYAKEMSAFLGNKEIKFESSGVVSKTSRIMQTFKESIDRFDEDEERFIAYTSTIQGLMHEATQSHRIFSMFDEQLRIRNRFGAFVDPDIKHILPLKEFGQLVGNRSGSLPSFTPFMQILNIATNTLQYNWNQISQPILNSVARENIEKEEMVDAEEQIEDERIRQKILRTLIEIHDDLKNKLAPDSSKRFIDQLKVSNSIGTIVSKSSEVGREFKVTGNFLSDLAKGNYHYLPVNVFLKKAVLRYKLKVGIDGTMMSKVGEDFRIHKAIMVMFYSENAYPNMDVFEARAEARAVAGGGSIEDAQEKEMVRRKLELQAEKARATDELHEFVMTPSMEFTQPPRCNVIIPRHLRGWSITRQFMQEPTRMYAKVKLTKNVYEFYIAPSSSALYYINPDHSVSIHDDAYHETHTEETSPLNRAEE